MCRPRVGEANPLFSVCRALWRPTATASRKKPVGRQRNLVLVACMKFFFWIAFNKSLKLWKWPHTASEIFPLKSLLYIVAIIFYMICGWFSSTNKMEWHNIAEILLRVVCDTVGSGVLSGSALLHFNIVFILYSIITSTILEIYIDTSTFSCKCLYRG
jgi:hypothetical protein